MNSDYQIEQLELEDILPSPTNPRTIFNETDLADLARSIARKGVIQPILVRRRVCDFRVEASGDRWAVINPFNTTMETCNTEEDARDAMRLIWERQPQYELIAGERRWRASKLAKVDLLGIEKRLARERKDAEKGQAKASKKATKAKEVHA